MESELLKMAQLLVKRKIQFKLTDENKHRFVIFGKRFSMEELLQLERQRKLTNFGLSEIAEEGNSLPVVLHMRL